MTGTLRNPLSAVCIAMVLLCGITTVSAAEERPRARDIGLVVGTFPTGPLNAITDVADVKVGHATVIEGDDIRTGVTAISIQAIQADSSSASPESQASYT